MKNLPNYGAQMRRILWPRIDTDNPRGNFAQTVIDVLALLVWVGLASLGGAAAGAVMLILLMGIIG